VSPALLLGTSGIFADTDVRCCMSCLDGRPPLVHRAPTAAFFFLSFFVVPLCNLMDTTFRQSVTSLSSLLCAPTHSGVVTLVRKALLYFVYFLDVSTGASFLYGSSRGPDPPAFFADRVAAAWRPRPCSPLFEAAPRFRRRLFL